MALNSKWKVYIKTLSLIKFFKFFFLCSVTLVSYQSYAAPSCNEFLESKAFDPSTFLHQRNGQLHTSELVEEAAFLYQEKTGNRLTRPKDKINAWLEYLEESYHQPERVERIKSLYLKNYVLSSNDVPESFFTNFMARAIREGRKEDANLSATQRTQLANNISNDQRVSLKEWLDFMFDEDSKLYPMWIKFWALSNVINMGTFSHDTGTYSQRSKNQYAPYPELNREAFALVVDAVLKKLNQENLESIKDKEMLSRLEGLSFSKLYGRQMSLSSAQNPKNMKITEGQWVKFSQGSDANKLYLSLNGRSTGWCIAGKATAEFMLKEGDFHIYFTKNEHNEFVIPRIAIRFVGQNIREVRGIYTYQNLDPFLSMTPILANKLDEFGVAADKFNRAQDDIERLARILQEAIDGVDISLEDLRFMYEIDRKIEGLGQKPDPRIRQYIHYSRDVKFDLVRIFNFRYKQDEISLTTEEALSKKSRLHYGDLEYLDATQLSEVHVPEVVLGELNMPKLKSAHSLTFPRLVHSIRLDSLESIAGVNRWPDNVYNNIFVSRTILSDRRVVETIPAKIYEKMSFIGPTEHVIGFRRGLLGGDSPFITIPLPP